MKYRNLFIITAFIAISGIIAIYIFNNKPEKKSKKTESTENQSEFTKNGTLSFIKANTNEKIKTIDIEIAKDDYSREKGLMYRRNMFENQGMLFIFEESSPRYFWMKNTYISLDLIYVDENRKIVSFQKSAVPLSEETLPSYKNAMYVVEVIAGFVDKFNIKEGDIIDF